MSDLYYEVFQEYNSEASSIFSTIDSLFIESENPSVNTSSSNNKPGIIARILMALSNLMTSMLNAITNLFTKKAQSTTNTANNTNNDNSKVIRIDKAADEYYNNISALNNFSRDVDNAKTGEEINNAFEKYKTFSNKLNKGLDVVGTVITGKPGKLALLSKICPRLKDSKIIFDSAVERTMKASEIKSDNSINALKININGKIQNEMYKYTQKFNKLFNNFISLL